MFHAFGFVAQQTAILKHGWEELGQWTVIVSVSDEDNVGDK